VTIDNLSARMTEEVDRWLRRHPRFHLHFTPTHSSWLNAVEGWFSRLTNEGLKRGSFRSVPELRTAIRQYVDSHLDVGRPRSMEDRDARGSLPVGTGKPQGVIVSTTNTGRLGFDFRSVRSGLPLVVGETREVP
jgi:hypothetical protein